MFLGFLVVVVAMAQPPHSFEPFRHVIRATSENYGVIFSCSRSKLTDIRVRLSEQIKSYGWNEGQVRLRDDGDRLMVQLNTPENDQSTLDLKRRPALKIEDETFQFRDSRGREVTKPVVSKREILAAMLQRGRVFEFSDDLCSFQDLMDHIALRQNVVKWTNRTMWNFPEGNDERLNPKMWTPDYSPVHGVSSRDALLDIFDGRFGYQIDCFTACKVFESHGAVDYFAGDRSLAEAMEKLLDRDPLHGMASQLDDDGKVVKQGKLLDQHVRVPPRNWVPGDWGYAKNTDAVSRAKYGDEGSNIVYIGGGMFPRFYTDHPSDRVFDTVLRYVYAMRFTGERYADAYSVDQSFVPKLEKTPPEGGLLWDYRDFPSLTLRRRLEQLRRDSALQIGQKVSEERESP